MKNTSIKERWKVINGCKGAFGNKIEKKTKSKECSKCKRVFIESTVTKCPFCGCRLKNVKMIIWN